MTCQNCGSNVGLSIHTGRCYNCGVTQSSMDQYSYQTNIIGGPYRGMTANDSVFSLQLLDQFKKQYGTLGSIPIPKEKEVPKMSTIKRKIPFQYVVVRNVRNDDLIIVDQEIVSNGIILATDEADARFRVGTRVPTDSIEDLEVLVKAF